MNAHGCVLEHSDAPREVGDHLGRQLTLASDVGSELAGVLLNVLDVGLELGAQLLQVLNDGTFDSLGEVGVRIGDSARLLALWNQGANQRLGLAASMRQQLTTP